MVVYEAGGFNSGYAAAGEAPPPSAADFASADVVLTTYETLQRDLHRHCLEAFEHKLRRPKKYQARMCFVAAAFASVHFLCDWPACHLQCQRSCSRSMRAPA